MAEILSRRRQGHRAKRSVMGQSAGTKALPRSRPHPELEEDAAQMQDIAIET